MRKLSGVPVLVLVVAAGGSALVAQPRADNLETAYEIECGGSQEAVLRGKVIETAGDGVSVSGNCDVSIVDSRIVAGGTAVRASGNGEVRIEYSYVEGRESGLRASGNAEIWFANTVVGGGLKSSGNAEIVDGGSNQVSGGGAPNRSGSMGDPTTGAVIDLPGVRIDSSGVRAGGVVIDSGGVTAGNTHVGTGADGAVVVGAPGASVVVDGDWVRIQSGGSVVEVDGDWRTAVRTEYDTSQVLVDLGAVQVDDGWRLNLAGDVLFDFDSAAVRADAADQLRKVAHVLRDRAAGDVVIIGHTDSVGEDAYNQELSEQRALAVMQWLNRNESIPVTLMKGQGMGEQAPVAHNTTPNGDDHPAGRAQNRRVEIQFSAR